MYVNDKNNNWKAFAQTFLAKCQQSYQRYYTVEPVEMVGLLRLLMQMTIANARHPRYISMFRAARAIGRQPDNLTEAIQSITRQPPTPPHRRSPRRNLNCRPPTVQPTLPLVMLRMGEGMLQVVYIIIRYP